MIDEPTAITYREIPGHLGYVAGTDGSVWSCRRGGFWVKRKPTANRYGHLMLTFGDRRLYVHQLILETFVGPCPNGMEACHFPDRDPANNQLTNLRWDTRKANSADRLKHGTDCRGKKQYSARLTEEDVRFIRDHSHGLTGPQLAKRFGVSTGHIGMIRCGKKWAWLK